MTTRSSYMTAMTRMLPLLAVAAAATVPAHGQTLDTMTESATQHIGTAWGYTINLACYIGGGFLLLFALWGFYAHRKNPGAGTSPGVSLTAAAVGSLLLAFAYFAGTMTRTITGQNVEANGSQKMMQFDE